MSNLLSRELPVHGCSEHRAPIRDAKGSEIALGIVGAPRNPFSVLTGSSGTARFSPTLLSQGDLEVSQLSPPQSAFSRVLIHWSRIAWPTVIHAAPVWQVTLYLFC